MGIRSVTCRNTIDESKISKRYFSIVVKTTRTVVDPTAIDRSLRWIEADEVGYAENVLASALRQILNGPSTKYEALPLLH